MTRSCAHKALLLVLDLVQYVFLAFTGIFGPALGLENHSILWDAAARSAQGALVLSAVLHCGSFCAACTHTTTQSAPLFCLWRCLIPVAMALVVML